MTLTPARLAIVALWLCSLVATWILARDNQRVAPAQATDACVVVQKASCPSIDDIRTAVREALPAARPPEEQVATVSSVASEAVAPDETVYLQARAALERDLADGHWSEEDRDRLNEALAQITRDQATELLAILFPRLNSGTVTSDIDGPPL